MDIFDIASVKATEEDLRRVLSLPNNIEATLTHGCLSLSNSDQYYGRMLVFDETKLDHARTLDIEKLRQYGVNLPEDARFSICPPSKFSFSSAYVRIPNEFRFCNYVVLDGINTAVYRLRGKEHKG